LTIVAALALTAACYLRFFGTVEWRSAAIRNQGKVIGLLAHARLEGAQRDRIRRIILGDQVALTPDHGQIASGYVFTAHLLSSRLTIEAHPVWNNGTILVFLG
jgi:hypothetical protein